MKKHSFDNNYVDFSLPVLTLLHCSVSTGREKFGVGFRVRLHEGISLFLINSVLFTKFNNNKAEILLCFITYGMHFDLIITFNTF